MEAGVSIKMAEDTKNNLKTAFSGENISSFDGNYNRRRKNLEKAISGEVLKLLDQGMPPFVPEKSKSSIDMFVGLQGSGKTTTCAKYAQLHQKQGFKAAIICADTIDGGAFSRIKDFLGEDYGVFCFGSSTEHGAAKVALEGIEASRKQNCDLIVLDTFGCYSVENALFNAVTGTDASANETSCVIPKFHPLAKSSMRISGG